MCEKGGKGKKASFRVNGRGRGLKSAKGPREVRRSRSPARSSSPQITFAEYNISHIPVAARPCQSKENKGRHGYTLCSQDGSRARIEVLLRQKAFFAKVLADGAPGPVGQLSFGKFDSIESAWAEAKRRVGFVGLDDAERLDS